MPKRNGIEVGPNSPLLKKVRAATGLSESAIQKAAVALLVGEPVKGRKRQLGDGKTGMYPELFLLTTFRGQSAFSGEAGRMKAEGALDGYPDLFLPVARGGCHALYVEVKTEDGVLSPRQKLVRQLLEEQRNCVYVERRVEAIVARFVWYVSTFGRAP